MLSWLLEVLQTHGVYLAGFPLSQPSCFSLFFSLCWSLQPGLVDRALAPNLSDYGSNPACYPSHPQSQSQVCFLEKKVIYFLITEDDGLEQREGSSGLRQKGCLRTVLPALWTQRGGSRVGWGASRVGWRRLYFYSWSCQ